METPVGNPNVSLLPQPAVPAPIEAMRGGGMGGGNETVSLLPQPAVPAPIEPMRGGGPENVSLLPQPAVPQPIEPMKGGGFIPLLTGVEIEKTILSKSGTVTSKKESLPKITPPEFVPLTKKIVDNYIKYRKLNVWKGQEIPKSDASDQVTTYKKQLTSQVVVYYFQVRTYEQYLKIQEKIKKLLTDKRSDKGKKAKEKDTLEYIFIIIFDEESGTDLTPGVKATLNTENQKTYESMFRSFIFFTNELHGTFGSVEPMEDDFQIFFLSKRKIVAYSRPKNEDKSKINEKGVENTVKYLEPDSVCLTVGEGPDVKTICFLSPKKISDSDTSAIRAIKGVTNAIYITNSKKETIPLNIKVGYDASKLEISKRYFIDLDWLNWYTVLTYKEGDVNSLSNIFEPEEEDEKEKGKAGPSAKRGATSTGASASTTAAGPKKPAVSVGTMTNESLTKPTRVFKLEDKEPYVTVDLGEQMFKIRTYNEATVTEWKAGKFTDEEQKLFQAIGFDKEFVDKAAAAPTSDSDELLETRKELVAGRGKLLEILSSTTCLKTSDFMMKSECEFMREFLQDLLYVRQLDRIQAITKQLSGVDDFFVEVGKVKEADELRKKLAASVYDILDNTEVLLKRLTRKSATKLAIPTDLVFNLIDLFKESPLASSSTDAAAASSAAASASSSTPPSRFSLLGAFSRSPKRKTKETATDYSGLSGI